MFLITMLFLQDVLLSIQCSPPVHSHSSETHMSGRLINTIGTGIAMDDTFELQYVSMPILVIILKLVSVLNTGNTFNSNVNKPEKGRSHHHATDTGLYL